MLIIWSAFPAVLLLLSSLALGSVDYYNDGGGGGDAYYDDYLPANEEPLSPVSILPPGGSFLVECPAEGAAAGRLLHNGKAADMRGVSWRPSGGGNGGGLGGGGGDGGGGGYLIGPANVTHSGTWSCSDNPQAS